MRRLLFFLLFTVSFLCGLALIQAGRYRDVFRSICDLTAERFYKDDERLRRWVASCRQKAAKVPYTYDQARLLALVQDQLSEMSVSHFNIYSPAEDRKLWQGEAVDTGIRSRYVEDLLIVHRVYAGSAADKAGVRAGDVITGLPGSDQVTPWGAEHRTGMFQIRRGDESREVFIRPEPLVIDSSPQLTPLGRGAALLAISSFRSEFFPAPEWRKLAARLSGYSHIVVDVRENAGGNFVAMLRALSTFECGERRIGRLVQPRKAGAEKGRFDDETGDAHQLKELGSYRSIGLSTFAGYGCYGGKVTVLISHETSSVAEIFADRFKVRPNSRVWGQPSAGDVVLAVWYDLPDLGRGYSFSIPEAVYLNSAGKELEGSGVYPQKDLFYERRASLRGEDNWLSEALAR